MWCVTRHTSIVPSSGPVNRRRVWETGDTTLTERWLTGSRSAPPQAWAMAGILWQEFRALRLLVGVELVFTHTCWQRAPSSHEVHTNFSEEAQTHTNMSTIKSMARTRNKVKTQVWLDRLAASGVSNAAMMTRWDKDKINRMMACCWVLVLIFLFQKTCYLLVSLSFLSLSLTHCLKSLKPLQSFHGQSDELIPDEGLTFDRLMKWCCWQAD